MYEKAHDCIDQIKERIDSKLKRGFTHDEAYELSGIISDIKTIECYLHEYSDDPIWRLLKSIEDELKASEKYIAWWKDTGDTAIKAIAADELKHASSLISATKQKPMDEEQTACLQKLVAQHQQVAARLA